MSFVIGPIADVQALNAQVSAAMGYPMYGVDVMTGQRIMPTAGQDPSTVPGVTLCWQDVVPSSSDPTQGYLTVDATNGPYVNNLYNATTYPSLSFVDTLPDGWSVSSIIE